MQEVCNRFGPFRPPNYFILYKYFEYKNYGPNAKVLGALPSVETLLFRHKLDIFAKELSLLLLWRTE
jgi:hypothetical protein